MFIQNSTNSTVSSNDNVMNTKYDIEVKAVGLIDNKLTSIGETRRFRFIGSSYQELSQQIVSLFKFTINNPRLQWVDEDNDLISFSSDQELDFLIQKLASSQPPSNILKIYVHILVSGASVASNPVAPPLPSNTFINPSATVQSQVQIPVFNSNINNNVTATTTAASVNLLDLKQRKQALKQMISDNKDNWKNIKKMVKEERHKIRSETKLLRCEIRAKKQQQREAVLASIGSSPSFSMASDGKKKSKDIAARFVQHVGIGHLAQITPGSDFIKTFRFRNEGSKAWPETTELVFVSKLGDKLGGPDSVKIGKEVLPGEEVDISIPLKAPNAPGKYVGFWRLRTGSDGFKFGQRVDVTILVSESPSTTTTSPSSTSSSSDSDSSSSSSSDDDEKSKDVTNNDTVVNNLVEILKAMGYKDKKGIKEKLVRKCDGNMDLVVVKLNKKIEKFAKRAEKKASKKAGKDIHKAEKKQKRLAHKAEKAAKQEKKQQTFTPTSQ